LVVDSKFAEVNSTVAIDLLRSPGGLSPEITGPSRSTFPRTVD